VPHFVHFLGPSILCSFLAYPTTRLVACKLLLLAASAPPPTGAGQAALAAALEDEGISALASGEAEFVRQCSFQPVLDGLNACLEGVTAGAAPLSKETRAAGTASITPAATSSTPDATPDEHQQILDIVSVLVQKLSKCAENRDLLLAHPRLLPQLCWLAGQQGEWESVLRAATRAGAGAGGAGSRPSTSPRRGRSVDDGSPHQRAAPPVSEFFVLNVQSVLLHLNQQQQQHRA
jgi:hypothetical protein